MSFEFDPVKKGRVERIIHDANLAAINQAHSKQRLMHTIGPQPQDVIANAQALIELMARRIEKQQQRITELETEVSLVEEDRDTALELLLWPLLVKHATTEEVLAYLGEHGLNPRNPEHAEEIAAFLERKAESSNESKPA